MIKATRNQLTNISNPHQSKGKKVLCVCSAGLLRSPTLADVLHKELGYNTRAVGTAKDFCLIPITEALIHWADEIVFVDEDCKDYLDIDTQEELKFSGVKITTLNIPDHYEGGSNELEDICLQQYTSSEIVNSIF